MVEIVAAFLGAGALVLTSGFAFGAVRRRKAISEMIKIRSDLEKAHMSVAEIEEVIKREIAALDKLGDASRRRFGFFVVAAEVCFFGAAFLWWLSGEVDGARVQLLYGAAGLALVVVVTAIGLFLPAWERVWSSTLEWHKFLRGSAVLVTNLVVVAVMLSAAVGMAHFITEANEVVVSTTP